MNKIILLLLCCSIIVPAYSQSYNSQIEQEDVVDVANKLLKINIISPGIAYEKRIAENVTVQPEVNLIGLSMVNLDDNYLLYFGPKVNVSARFYYNLSRRISKGKSIYNNSGNYFSIDIGHQFPLFKVNTGNINVGYYPTNLQMYNVQLAGFYGIQRSWNSNLYLDAQFGIGLSSFYNLGNYPYIDNGTSLTSMIKLKFGYILGM